MGWAGDGTATTRTLLTLPPFPQRTPGQSTENPSVSPHPNTEQLPAAPPLCGGLAFMDGSRRVSHCPLPKSESGAGLGYTDSAERNVITAGAERGFKGL